MKRVEFSPLARGVTGVELVRVAERLDAVANDASRVWWLRELADRKRVEARAFARVAFMTTVD